MSESKKTLHMGKYFPYNEQSILDNVNDEDIGNYALGSMNGETFVIRYVGRTDEQSVRERLLQHLNRDEWPDCTCFKFTYASSAQEAYELECRNYHDFGEPDGKLHNKNHPAKPENMRYLSCPMIGCDK